VAAGEDDAFGSHDTDQETLSIQEPPRPLLPCDVLRNVVHLQSSGSIALRNTNSGVPWCL